MPHLICQYYASSATILAKSVHNCGETMVPRSARPKYFVARSLHRNLEPRSEMPSLPNPCSLADRGTHAAARLVVDAVQQREEFDTCQPQTGSPARRRRPSSLAPAGRLGPDHAPPSPTRRPPPTGAPPRPTRPCAADAAEKPAGAAPDDKSATAPAKVNPLVGLAVFSSDGSKLGNRAERQLRPRRQGQRPSISRPAASSASAASWSPFPRASSPRPATTSSSA